MNILDYIEKNKEWLFSGVGIVIIGFIASQIWHRLSPRKESGEGGVVVVQVPERGKNRITESIAGQPAHITKITPITLAEIVDAIEKAPPLQKEDVAKHYSGIIVQWETKLFSATKQNKDNIRLTLDFGPRDTYLVYCEVRLSEYRELGVLPKGATITVMGKIKRVEWKAATLEEVQLFIHGDTNESNT